MCAISTFTLDDMVRNAQYSTAQSILKTTVSPAYSHVKYIS